jgi:hypothetical protein
LMYVISQRECTRRCKSKRIFGLACETSNMYFKQLKEKRKGHIGKVKVGTVWKSKS